MTSWKPQPVSPLTSSASLLHTGPGWYQRQKSGSSCIHKHCLHLCLWESCKCSHFCSRCLLLPPSYLLFNLYSIVWLRFPVRHNAVSSALEFIALQASADLGHTCLLLLSSAEVRLAFYRPGTVWSLTMWLPAMLRCTGVHLSFTSALSCPCGLENDHSPVATLSGWATDTTIMPGAQLPLVTLLEDLFLVSPSTVGYMDHSIPDSCWDMPYISQFYKSSSAPIQELSLNKCLSTFHCFHFIWKMSQNHSPVVGSSLILLFTLGLETQADCVFNSELNCHLSNVI